MILCQMPSDIDFCSSNWSGQLQKDPNNIAVIRCDDFKPDSYDLYTTIQSLHRNVFSNDQKIIFVITKDYYTDEPSGMMLQSVQRMINLIDISNFFVHVITTNTEIHDEYQWVLENISTDKVPVNFKVLDGPYQRIINHNEKKFHAANKVIDPTSLSEKHKNFLFQSRTFCMHPWTSMLIEPNGDVAVCCKSTEIIGNCSRSSIKDIWNSPEVRQLRLDMLADKKIDSCQQCYHLESEMSQTYSTRTTSLLDFGHLIDRIDSTDQDGSIGHDPVFWTPKFNNLCNLACRSCKPKYSSSWHQPAVAIGRISPDTKPVIFADGGNKDMLPQIIEYLDTAEQLLCEGGEPLIIEEFWTLLKELDVRQRYDMIISYNTNLTKSSFKGQSIFDLWKKFQNISVAASLDAEGNRGEYLRPGAPWRDIEQFRKDMLEKTPHVHFEVHPTLSILNALHLPDFHRSWTEKGYVDAKNWVMHFLVGPRYLSLRTAPESLRNKIKEKYLKHLDWLRPLDTYGKSIATYENVLSHIENPLPFDAAEFWKNIKELDRYHKVDLLEVFPELQDLPKQ